MRTPEPILAGPLFAPLHDELMALLGGLSAAEWRSPTAAGAWAVKDVAAHLLDTALRRLALQRDGHSRPGPFDPNAANREWIVAAERLSPRVLTDMLERYARQQADYLASLDPYATAQWAVTWAGEESSPVWFDLARELTERWHHQQQIRDATGRPPLYDARYFAPVIDTFMRGLPHAYASVDAPEGTAVVVHVTDEGEGSWTLRRDDRWRLFAGAADGAVTEISLRGDAAWRLFTKGLTKPDARVQGDPAYAGPLLRMICVIG
jgi:uncharacterized protein (TIGR03083 family)